MGEAYRWGLPGELLALNQRCAAAEHDGRPIAGPGLPAFCDGRFLADDCLRMPDA